MASIKTIPSIMHGENLGTKKLNYRTNEQQSEYNL